MTSITHTPDAEVVLARLHTMRSDLLAQIAQQRGGTVSRAEMATDHFSHSEDTRADTNTARDLEFALNERETEELFLSMLLWCDCTLGTMANVWIAPNPLRQHA